MLQKDSAIHVYVTMVAILVSFFWIGYAYIMGTKADQMILHPIVPLLLIALLLRFRKYEPTKFVITIALIFIGLWLFVRLQFVFMPFIIGFALAYIVSVVFSGLQNIPLPKGKCLHLPKWTAVIVLLVLVTGIITFFAFGIIPQLVQQVSDMQDGMSIFYENIRDYAVKTAGDISNGDYPLKDRLPTSWQESVGEYIDTAIYNLQKKIPSLADSVSQIIGSILGRLSAGIVGTFGKISSVFFIIIVFVYALQSLKSHVKNLVNVFPENQRERITRYLREIEYDMRAFLKGQLSAMVIISIISIIGFSIIRLPFALLVGLLAGLLNAIPTIGPVITGVIAVLATLTGFAAGDYGLSGLFVHALLAVGVTFGVQTLDNAFISTRIMSKVVEMHPLVVMFAVLFAASLAGVWGALLTIPVLVIIKGIINVRKQINTGQKSDNKA
jgi:predicted PurR-regulated permease PerM